MSITINIKKGGENFEKVIPTEWSDMTLSYWFGIYNILRRSYDKNRAKDTEEVSLFAETFDFEKKILDELGEMHLNKELFAYMTGLNDDEVSLVDVDSVNSVINVVSSLLEDYEPKGLRSFTHNDKTYNYPSEMFTRNTYGDYIESTQLDFNIEMMKHGRFDVIAEQMAIMCREDGEIYDEKLIESKGEEFKNLKMDTIWEFAFFLTIQNQKLRRNFRTSLEAEEGLVLTQLKQEVSMINSSNLTGG